AWQRSDEAPAYWFGHGLGYTDWAYESVDVSAGSGNDSVATVDVELRNAGGRVGREVVQVYLAPATPDPDRPARWLAGFAAVSAGPGESVRTSISLPRRTAEIWNDGWTLVPGAYRVEVGRSVADIRLTAPLDL
ncbi:MAG TPA: fibronectin type III-like domain-contianing protein, partial [Actinopolymorphaceae bacterium]|nr:fibronectin type III-like domain-contianing protein [Actinopolymorphaceae bacterium]